MLNFLLNPTHLIQTAGLFGVFTIIFIESGLFFGFFLPGDSLLFTAGFLASQGYLNIWWLMLGSFLAAVLGVMLGYAFGAKVGPSMFKDENSFFFKKSYMDRSQDFFAKHGARAIILSRFTPIVRTFAPIVAGIGKMKYSTFLTYNVIGGLLWCVGLSALGFFLGHTIPNVDKYLLPIIIVIIIISFIPSAYHFWQNRKQKSVDLPK